MIILRCPNVPQRGLKTQNGRFPSKIALRLKKVCYKVYSCENCQRQSFRAFIGITTHAEMIGGERTLLPEILGQTERVGAKSPIFYLFSLVAPQPLHLAKKVQLSLKAHSHQARLRPSTDVDGDARLRRYGTHAKKRARSHQAHLRPSTDVNALAHAF